MEENKDRRAFWNLAGTAGLALGLTSTAFMFASQWLTAVEMPSFLSSIVSFIMWTAKFVGCIWEAETIGTALALAADAFHVVYANLPASFHGNCQVRQRIHTAATMAGLAFSQAGLGICHAIAHSLGGLFHLPHGRLNAILLPAVIDCNAHTAAAKYARLARSSGLGGAADTVAVRNLKNALIRLRKELKMPETLAQAGIEPGLVWHHSAQIVKAVLADPCCKTNPMRVEDFMVRRILEEVTGRA